MGMDADRTDEGRSMMAQRSRRRMPRHWLPTMFVVVLLLVGAVSIWAWMWAVDERDSQKRAEAADHAAVDAARDVALDWTRVDYKNADGYVDLVASRATGSFHKEFTDSADALVELMKANKSVQTATIPPDGIGLIERTADTAQVAVALDAEVTNVSTPTPAPRQYRLRITLELVDGEWLTSGLEFVG